MMRQRRPYFEIKEWLNANNISQKKIAEEIGTSTNYINRKLNGTGPDFKLDEARTMHWTFGVPMSFFFVKQVPFSEQKGVNKNE